jgi:hypothetical protein
MHVTADRFTQLVVRGEGTADGSDNLFAKCPGSDEITNVKELSQDEMEDFGWNESTNTYRDGNQTGWVGADSGSGRTG